MQMNYKNLYETRGGEMNCIDNHHVRDCKLLTLKKISTNTGIPVGTLRQFRTNGLIPSLSFKFGRLVVGHECEVQRDLENIISSNVR